MSRESKELCLAKRQKMEIGLCTDSNLESTNGSTKNTDFSWLRIRSCFSHHCLFLSPSFPPFCRQLAFSVFSAFHSLPLIHWGNKMLHSACFFLNSKEVTESVAPIKQDQSDILVKSVCKKWTYKWLLWKQLSGHVCVGLPLVWSWLLFEGVFCPTPVSWLWSIKRESRIMQLSIIS